MFAMKTTQPIIVTLLFVTANLWFADQVFAHCDAEDGPVARDVQRALHSGELADVLKWVDAADEAQVQQVYEQARQVRTSEAQAAALADRYFLETVVRLHRQSEGEPYTGLKPAGLPLPEPVKAVDHALAAGSVEALIARLQQQVEHAVRSRFERARAAAAHRSDGVEAGRSAVHAYVELVHYVKHLHEMLTDAAADHAPAADAGHAPNAAHREHPH